MIVAMKKAFGFLLLVAVLALALLPSLRNLEQGPLDEVARRDAPGDFVPLAHGDVHYQIAGPESGVPVVLVHGFSVPSYVWEPLDERLAGAGFRVIRFDLYGRGWSARPDVRYDRDLFADQLRELLDALQVRRAHVIGLSMGGAVVARFAAAHPSRVDRIGLIAPVTVARDISPLQWPVIGEWLTRVRVLPALADGQLSDFVHPERHAGWAERFRPQMAYDGFGHAILSTLRHTISRDSLADFGALAAQGKDVMLVWGRQDSVLPFEQSGQVRAAIPQALFLPVDESGHLPHIEQTEIVAPAIITFLRGPGNGTAPVPPSTSVDAGN
jgi:pimeloyl-ACP methyl ester carboxylesterase